MIFWKKLILKKKQSVETWVQETLKPCSRPAIRMSNSWKPPPSLNRPRWTWVLCSDKWSNNIWSQGCIGKWHIFFRNLDKQGNKKIAFSALSNKKVWHISRDMFLIWSMIHEINDFRNDLMMCAVTQQQKYSQSLSTKIRKEKSGIYFL